MKIISLNTCGGTLRAPLMGFILREAPSTDVFCFQEVFRNDAGILELEGARMNLFGELRASLPGFVGNFAPVMRGRTIGGPADRAIEAGDALFVKQELLPAFNSRFIARSYSETVEEDGETGWPAVLQSVTVPCGGSSLVVAHLHGVSLPGHKLDTPERLAQSDAIAGFVRAQSLPVVLLGDFNLLPETQGIARIEEIPMRNLIKEYGIQTTRPVNHLLRYSEHNRQFFADYAFVSPHIAVKKFSVPDIEISDHLPLILELA